MATLHLINKPGEPFHLCQRALTAGDALFFIEDGVYLLQSAAEQLSAMTHEIHCHYLMPDAQARGITPQTQSISPANYEQFVQLTTDYPKVISWF